MPKTLFKVDLTKPMGKQEIVGHNRWHPDIPTAVTVKPGDVFRIECKDWTDGQIKNDDDPSDIEKVKLTVVHVLSGPIYVEGAAPGDILVVDLMLPDLNGMEIAREVRRASPATKILVITAHPSDRLPAELMVIGVNGYVDKTEPIEYVLSAVETVRSGGMFFASRVPASQ